jgi:hypothetical protein
MNFDAQRHGVCGDLAFSLASFRLFQCSTIALFIYFNFEIVTALKRGIKSQVTLACLFSLLDGINRSFHGDVLYLSTFKRQ